MEKHDIDKADSPNKRQKNDGPLFVTLDDETPVTTIESVCMGCYKNGTTRLMLTKVPHFKEVIVSSFFCPHCGYTNNEVQSAEAIQEKGQEWKCKIQVPADMNRQIVRNFSATVRIEELDMELPPIKSTRLTTVEGLLSGIIQDLEGDQPARREQSIEIYNAIENIIAKLKGYLRNEEPFLLTINDPSGNSYIESLQPPNLDPSLSMRVYQRTREQEIQLGMVSDEAEEDSSKPEQMDTIKEEDEEMKPVNEEVGAEEVITFHTNCHICNAPCETHMKQVDIPHFKNVIIMATNCDGCGYKSNEVKSGGAIADKGTKITLKLVCEEDLSRDILKSETCALSIPEINLHLTLGTLGGRFTTVEGLLRQVYDDLDRETPFSSGDSAVQERREKFRGFLQQLDDLIEGKSFPFNLILDDPASNSYLQNLYAPDNDPNMTIETYARNAEQNESLGLDTINVDHYAE